MEYSDHELVRGIKSGDQSALELLVRRWYPRIYGYVFKLTGHEQDAYDLTQDVFIAMMQSIGSYTPWRKFDSWLFTIAHNKCMDYFRFRQKIVQAEDTMFDRPDPAASFEDMAAVSMSVKAALEKLPAAQREAVILHYFHQFTAKEINCGRTSNERSNGTGNPPHHFAAASVHAGAKGPADAGLHAAADRRR